MNGHERFENNNAEETFRIGQLAEEFDVTLRTLRFYEDKELLAPRRIGNTRIYSRSDRARLRIILLGKRLGFSLADVAEILALYDPESGNVRQLKVSLEKGEEQLTKLKNERERLDASIDELQKTIVSFRNMLAEAESK
ncbi:MerR family transcriptional regulator [Ahrensia marina]|uniref:Transcriptional regulator n=1 Tax=Ahrensia marina TaxID=1514904 RepID=A0A0M9GPA4_9HYPH|nr:MerR family DNA-binding transcriptional regulator [Ahrensia marina]KPB02480.1 transcriptional regulator [Ahrensia marina]